MMKTLNEIPKKNPFKVPENYFEDVNRKIISAAAGNQPGESRKGTLRRLRPMLAVAASIAAITLLSYTAIKIFRPESGRNLPDVLTSELRESYLSDIDTQTLEQYTDPAFLNEGIPNLTTSEIIDYLSADNIDINDIYERL
jgi:hypothetical protein